MPMGSAPIVPRGFALRICLFHRQIHGSRRRAGARVRGGIFGGYDARPQCWTRYWCRYGKLLYDLYN